MDGRMDGANEWMTPSSHPFSLLVVIQIKVVVPNSVTILIIHTYLSGMVWLQERIPKRHVFKRVWTMIIILGSISNMIKGTYMTT